MIGPSSTSTLEFAELSEVYGPDFGLKGRGSSGGVRKRRPKTAERDDACLAVSRAGAGSVTSADATTTLLPLGDVMDTFIASGTRVLDTQDVFSADVEKTGSVTARDESDTRTEAPVTSSREADLPAHNGSSVTEQQQLLDAVLFVFGGVLLIFVMEQMVQLGIQLGQRSSWGGP
jgi:hypothetical protein